VPIQYNKVLVGVINIYLEDWHRYDPREEEILSSFAITLAGIIWRKRSEDKLRTLSRRLVSVQEEERRSIALELHDQIGQMLTGLKLMINQVARAPAKAQTPILLDAQSVLGDLIGKVREMSLNLRPSMLDDLGLLPTLIWHFQQCKASSNLEVDFRHSGLERQFSKDTAIAAYRIIQEALTNIMRYAGVDRVMVQITADDNFLYIRIEDKGKGFKPTEVSISNSVGLQGMRERAMLLGGGLTIDSRPGEGTTITAELPLSENSEGTKTSGIR
jgi:signal transduction histidine kinase